MIRLSQKSFTLVELLVVFSVFVILASLLSANLKKLSDVSYLNQCKTQLKTVHMATMLYTNDNSGILPGPIWSGQSPTIGKYALAGHIGVYMESIRRSDNKANILKEMICPNNKLESSNLNDDMRLHFRTHISPNSSTYFGYPLYGVGKSFHTIALPDQFVLLRGMAKPEFKTGSKPGWYDLLADLSPHFESEVNKVFFSGRIDQETFLP